MVSLDKSDGVVARNEQYLKQWQESVIKVYFFGDAKRSLSPQIQQVSFDDIVVFKVPECKLDTPRLSFGYSAIH